MQRPRPLADPFMRSVLSGAVVTGLVVSVSFAALVAAPMIPARVAAGSAVAGVVLAYALGLFISVVTYRLGWYARRRDEHGRVSGHWLAYPVDVDGVPTTAPVTGRMVLDEPVEVERR